MQFLTREDLATSRGITYCNVHMLRLERAGLFPRRVKLGENTHPLWLASEVDQYLTRAIAKRDSQARAASKPPGKKSEVVNEAA